MQTGGKLTRERIARMLGQGLTNKEIASALHITERTVKWHIGIMMERAGLHGSGDERLLIVLAARGRLEQHA